MAQWLPGDLDNPQLPHSLEAEQAVIGGLMLANDAYHDVAAVVSEADFFIRDHRIIFGTMGRLAAAEQPLDALTLAETLKNSDQLAQAGGDAYLVELVTNAPSTTNIRDFVNWVNNLPEREPPTYLGLPANAEKLLLVGHGRKMISDLSRVTTLLDEGEQLMVDN